MALPWKSYRFLFKKLSKTQHVSGVFVDVEVNVDGDLHIDLDDIYIMIKCLSVCHEK